MKKLDPNKLQEILKNCHSKADFCRALDLEPKGGNYRIIDNLISKHNLETFFKNEPWNKGKCYRNKIYSLEEILIENSPHRNTYSLRERLIRAGLKEHKCEICGYSERIELHHINGNSSDNRLENLQILCPNCHAKTDNYRVKNSEGYKKRQASSPETLYLSEEEIQQRELERKAKKCNKTVEEYLEYQQNKKVKSKKETKICPVCGKEFIPKDSTSKYCSVECYHIDTKGNRPSLLQLIRDFQELRSFIQVGKKYGVSDNAVRKWCKLYQIPCHTKELQECINSFNNPEYIPKEYVKKERKQLDHQKIINDYNSGMNTSEIARINNCDSTSVRNVLNRAGIMLRSSYAEVIQCDGDKEIQTFSSTGEAAKWLIENGITSAKIESIRKAIRACCQGKRKIAYSYNWKYK